MKSHVNVGAFGGRIGFYARVLFPRLCSFMYLSYLRFKAKAPDKKYIEWAMEQESLKPLFVHIETINRCNGTCSFCPCNKNADKRKLKVMEEAIFNKIIDDLAAVEYDGIVMLNANCEPFLDQRMAKFINIAYDKLPKAQKILFTNGTLISESILEEIAGKLNTLYINNYSTSYEMTDTSKRIYNYIKVNEEKFENMQINIEFRYANEILTNKGGKAPNKQNVNKVYKNLCPNPFMETIIYPDGVIGLCCNDNYEVTNFGNVNDNTIFEIFNNEALKKVRQAMREGRNGYDFCKYCDFVSKGGRRERWIKTGRD